MMTADSMITLLRQAAGQCGDARIRAPYDTLMGQLAAHLVGEPLEDGEISDAEWVLLAYSLRQLSVSPRGASAWASLRQHAAALETAMAQTAQPAQAAAQASDSASSPRRTLDSLKAAWSRALNRGRAPQPSMPVIHEIPVQASSSSVTIKGDQNNIKQVIGPIKNSTGVTITGVTFNGNIDSHASASDEAEEDTAPVTLPPVSETGRKCDVFLSYSRRDARQMRRVRADLITAGFEVWTDDSLQPGSMSWLHAIEEAIAMSLCVVVLLSPDAKRSEWVEKELVTARNYGKQIIPLLLRGDDKSAVPIIIANAQYADTSTETKYRSTMQRLIPIITNLKRGAEVRV